jgi:hypothetical protein
LIAKTNPTAHKGIPKISLKRIEIKVPFAFPHLTEYVVVKALARFEAKPRTRGIRNQYISSPVNVEIKM